MYVVILKRYFLKNLIRKNIGVRKKDFEINGQYEFKYGLIFMP